MTTNTSSTAVATSDLAERVETAIKHAVGKLDKERLQHLQDLRRRADEFAKKGLLCPREYASSSSADFRKRYLSVLEG
jgi:hypothetical protein